MNQPPPIPTVDVTEAERRLREDPDRPILLDVRETGEFAEVRAPGAVLVPTSDVHDPRRRAAGRPAAARRVPRRRPVRGRRRAT